MKTATEIQDNLRHFYGSENFYRVNPFDTPRLFMTEGIKYLADNAECYWILDIVASVLRLPQVLSEDFLICKIVVSKEKDAVITLDDGNSNIVYRQKIMWTDFPIPEFSFYVERSGENLVAMLKSER